MADNVRIVSTKEEQRPNPAGKFRPVIETTFMIGDDGPFRVNSDEDTFDPANHAQLIAAKVASVRGIRGAVEG